MINFSRHLFCIFLALVMLLGSIQIGLRWDSLQPVSRVFLTTKNGQYVTGVLSQNWSGDFVVDDKGDIHAITPSRITSFQVIQGLEVSSPWRIILSIFIAMIMSATTWLLAMGATTTWMNGLGLSLRRPR